MEKVKESRNPTPAPERCPMCNVPTGKMLIGDIDYVFIACNDCRAIVGGFVPKRQEDIELVRKIREIIDYEE